MNNYFNLDNVTELYNQRAEHLENNYWFTRAKESGPITDSYLKSFDNIISIIGENDKNILRKKFSDIIPEKSNAWRVEYDDHFLDTLTEILGFGYLIDQGYSPSFQTTPDLVGRKGSTTVAMECKNFTSNYSIQGEYKRLFNEKMNNVLNKAETQVNTEKNAEKIIFVNVNVDKKNMLQSNQEQMELVKDLQSKTDSLKSKKIDVVFFKEYNYHNLLLQK